MDPPGVSRLAPPSMQRVGHVHVISAGRPVQGGLGPISAAVVVGVSPGLEEQGDRGGGRWEIARPVGSGVQRGAPAALETFTTASPLARVRTDPAPAGVSGGDISGCNVAFDVVGTQTCEGNYEVLIDGMAPPFCCGYDGNSVAGRSSTPPEITLTFTGSNAEIAGTIPSGGSNRFILTQAKIRRLRRDRHSRSELLQGATAREVWSLGP